MSRHNRERRKRRRDGKPEYAGAVVTASEQAMARGDLKLGNVYLIPVRHERRCALLAGTGPCDCNPEIGKPERVPNPEEN